MGANMIRIRLSFIQKIQGLALVLAVAMASQAANADILSYTQFVQTGKFALGVEPQLIVTRGAGLGVTARYTHGVNELINASLNVGSGSGPRQGRLGAAATFDFFPDMDHQPGIGLTVQADYVRAPRLNRVSGSDEMATQMETLAIPYVHKAVSFQKHQLDPFFALPTGLIFQDGLYRGKMSAVVGSMFKVSENIRTSMEAGVAISQADSYLSGGLTYYY